MEVRGRSFRCARHGSVRRRKGATLGKDRRAQHLRPQPPALLRLPARHEHRRRREQRHEVDSIPEPGPALNPRRDAWIGARHPCITRQRRTRLELVDRVAAGRSPTRRNATSSAARGVRARRRGRGASDGQGRLVHLRRGGTSQHNLWITRYDAEREGRGGRTTCISRRTAGAPEVRRRRRPLENADVVLSYTVGAHTWCGRRTGRDAVRVHGISPRGGRLLRWHPALDIPPSPPAACHHH